MIFSYFSDLLKFETLFSSLFVSSKVVYSVKELTAFSFFYSIRVLFVLASHLTYNTFLSNSGEGSSS